MDCGLDYRLDYGLNLGRTYAQLNMLTPLIMCYVMYKEECLLNNGA